MSKKTIEVNTKLLTPAAIIMAGLVIALAVFLTNSKRSAQVPTNTLVATDPQPTQTAPPTQAIPPAVPDTVIAVGVDDDPALGDPNAPITMIEFSDYECPFCKRSFTDVLPSLTSEYIDKGLVRLVYRDFPLGFHKSP